MKLSEMTNEELASWLESTISDSGGYPSSGDDYLREAAARLRKVDDYVEMCADAMREVAKLRSKLKASEAKAAAAASAANAPAAADGFSYFVQAGAFRTQGDADAQRAKLAMLGWEARISEREQNGRPVFRVRVGPFTKRGDAEQLKQKLDGAGVDSALVRVQQ